MFIATQWEDGRFTLKEPTSYLIGEDDYLRLSDKKMCKKLEVVGNIFETPQFLNVYRFLHPYISNPSLITIDASATFPGFDCLLYHGGSFIYYADMIPSIRVAGGQKRVDLVMKFLLQRRHLAPTHNAAPTIPTSDRDWLLIRGHNIIGSLQPVKQNAFLYSTEEKNLDGLSMNMC